MGSVTNAASIRIQVPEKPVVQIRSPVEANPLQVRISGNGTASAKDYEILTNKPRINNVELIGNKTTEELGIEEVPPNITQLEILKILKKARE